LSVYSVLAIKRDIGAPRKVRRKTLWHTSSNANITKLQNGQSRSSQIYFS